MTPPPRFRRRRISLSCLGLLAAAGLASWLARDLPRILVEAALAERLAARVRLERLELRGARQFVLAGLELEKIRDVPLIERLTIGELVVDGSLWDALDSRFERLRLRDVEARLAPAPPAEPSDRPLPEIGELLLDPALVRVAAADGGEDALLVVDARLRDFGTRLTGRAHLRSPQVSLEALFALADPASTPPFAGWVRDLEGGLELGPQGLDLTARAAAGAMSRGGDRLELDRPRWTLRQVGHEATHAVETAGARLAIAGGTASLEGPRLVATVVDAGGGTRSITVRPELDGLDDGSLAATWDPASRRLLSLDARLDDVDLERLLPFLGVAAVGGLELHGAGERLDVSLWMAPRRLDFEGGTLETGEGSALTIAGNLPFEPVARFEAPIWVGPVEASLDLPSARGRSGSISLPAGLFPATFSFAGRCLGVDPPRLAGDARLATAAAAELVAGGDITLGTPGASELAWRLTGVRLDELDDLLRQAGLPPLPLPLAGVAEADGRLTGPLARPAARGEIRLRELEIAGDGEPPVWGLDGGTLSAKFRWDGPGERIRLPAVSAAARLTAGPFRSLPLELQAAGWIDPSASRGEFDEAVLSSPGLGTANWAGSWQRPPYGPPSAAGELILKNLSLAAWQKAIGAPASSGPLAGFDLRGTAHAHLEAAADAAGAWRFAGPVELSRAGFASGDGSRVMEGLAGRWQLAASGAPASPVEIDLEGKAGGFLLLWNTFYSDFSAVEATLDAKGRQEPAPAGSPPPWRLEVHTALPGGPQAEATLERPAEGAGLRYSAALDDRDLAATHERYLAPLLKDALGRFELGGRLAAHARGSYRAAADDAPAAWSLLGALTIEDFRLASGGGQAAVAGLHLELPLELRRRPSPAPDFTGPRLTGRLAFERLALRGLELPPTDTDLWVEADAVGLEQPLALSILGGRLTLARLTLHEVLRPGRHLETGIELADVRLDRVAKELELFPLEGTLNGDFPLVRLTPDRLQVEGGGRMEVFGGVVEVRDISGEEVLTRFPKLVLSADFRDIDLGALTRRLDFGEMTGRVAGSLEDCELFRGVPVRFSAHLATVETKGVRRTVDVKAINNLTILGTGQGTNVFDLGLRKFFQKYTYAALGVTLRLADDRLLMHGLERRGDKELFLRGRLPFRIDVVNAQPGKTVSFQAMVQRLKSLDFAKASTN